MPFMYFVKKQPITYELFKSAASVGEGALLTITLHTTGLEEGTHVPYTITGISAEDLTGDLLTGEFVVTGDIYAGVATKTFNIAADFLAEGPETFTITLDGDLATASVTIDDTSATMRLVPLTAFVLDTNDVNNSQSIALEGTSSSGSITVSTPGRAEQTSFSPLTRPHGQWGVGFDGSGDSFTADSAGAITGTNDFTVEGWAYTPSFGTPQQLIANDTAGGFAMAINADGTIAFGYSLVADRLTTTTSTTAGTWNHLAVTRSGTTLRIFINGVIGATGTDSQNFPAGTVRFGADGNNSGRFFNGYLSNWRFVQGTALYTEGFAPSESPLQLVAGTKLLVCYGSSFKDYSNTNALIIPVNDTSVFPQSPFLFDEAGRTRTGGSAKISDATVSVSPASVAAFGTSDFTIETWMYRIAANSTMILDARPNNGNGPHVTWSVAPNGSLDFALGDPVIATAANLVPPRCWNHVAMSRIGSTIKCFVNGVEVANATNTTSITAPAFRICGNAFIGNQGDAYFADYRIVNGTATRTANFDVPTAPVGLVANTSAYMPFDNAGVFDSTAKNIIRLVGDTKVSTAQSHSGSSSVYFDGNDSIFVPYTQEFIFTNGDWTVETWFRAEDLTGMRTILSKDTYGMNFDFCIALQNGTSIAAYTAGTAANFTVPTGEALQTNTWYHVALVRNNGVNTFYLNGVALGTSTMTFTNSSSPVVVGCMSWNNPNSHFKGYLDTLKVLRYAKYTSNFVPV